MFIQGTRKEISDQLTRMAPRGYVAVPTANVCDLEHFDAPNLYVLFTKGQDGTYSGSTHVFTGEYLRRFILGIQFVD